MAFIVSRESLKGTCFLSKPPRPSYCFQKTFRESTPQNSENAEKFAKRPFVLKLLVLSNSGFSEFWSNPGLGSGEFRLLLDIDTWMSVVGFCILMLSMRSDPFYGPGCQNLRVNTYSPSVVDVVMNWPYSVSVLKEDGSKTFIKEGFLECIVSDLVHPFRKRLFIFYLHCCKLRSASWFYSHRKTEDCSPSRQWLEYILSHFDHFVNHILSKVDNLDAIGNLFK